MKDALRQQFDRLGYRLAELDTTLADGSVAADMKRYRALTREQSEVSSLVEPSTCRLPMPLMWISQRTP